MYIPTCGAYSPISAVIQSQRGAVLRLAEVIAFARRRGVTTRRVALEHTAQMLSLLVDGGLHALSNPRGPVHILRLLPR